MKKILLLIIALAGCGFAAQDITVSNDSLEINTHGYDFGFTFFFTSNDTAAISLDSAFIVIDTMDTTGSAGYVRDDSLQLMWRESIEMDEFFYWDLRKGDSNRFRMIQDTSKYRLQPLSFSAQVPQHWIVAMELGHCVGVCSGKPWYPPFFRGALVLHFSNGQTITLRLYSSEPNSSLARHIPDRQQLPGFAAGPVVRAGSFITITYEPTDDRARRMGIFDISGRMTATINLPAARQAAKTVRLNTAGFPAGWYCVRTISGASREPCGSFVIDR
jgi:hypothetical protein